MREIIVGLSHHRLEVLPHLRKYLEKADLVILEEPEEEGFEEYLKGKRELEDLIKEEELGFPEYTKELWKTLQEFYLKGKRILQIEPYLSRLKIIYKEIALKEEPQIDDWLQPVYEMERRCTGKLLEFYESTLGGDFERVINKVIEFSKADAERFRLRDEMRAYALIEKLPETGVIYIEAGTSHLHLLKKLGERIRGRGRLKVVFLLGEICKELTGKPWIYPPGELLTLKHILRHKMSLKEERLLSARALIFIKIIPKEELRPHPQNPYPHFTWELSAISMTNQLSFEDCQRLYEKIFPIKNYSEAFEKVKAFLKG